MAPALVPATASKDEPGTNEPKRAPPLLSSEENEAPPAPQPTARTAGALPLLLIATGALAEAAEDEEEDPSPVEGPAAAAEGEGEAAAAPGALPLLPFFAAAFPLPLLLPLGLVPCSPLELVQLSPELLLPLPLGDHCVEEELGVCVGALVLMPPRRVLFGESDAPAGFLMVLFRQS